MKIVRYVDFEAAHQILCEQSSFVLRGLRYYRVLEHRKFAGGDANESFAKFDDDASEFSPDGVLVSCWTVLNTDEVSWRGSASDAIAIVSTPHKVAAMLSSVQERIGLDEMTLRHQLVKYYDGTVRPHDYCIWDAMFWKSVRFASEREYRFAFIGGPRGVHTLGFYVDSEIAHKYIEQIHFSGDLDSTKSRQLVRGSIELQIADRVHEFNRLCRM